MKVKVFGTTAKEAEVEVSAAVFGVKESPKLLSQVVQSHLANRRRPIAQTKTIAEVRGGGKKPWRQKGTGSARAGSRRSPLWRGGGVTFGPRKNRNFSQRLPRKMAQKALKIALTDKFKNKKLIVVAKLAMDQISTSQMQNFLEKLPIEEGKILLVLVKTNVNLELSTANLKYLKAVLVANLNLIDILKMDYLITDKEGIKAIEGKFKNANSH